MNNRRSCGVKLIAIALLSLVASCLLSACGGGGGSAGQDPAGSEPHLEENKVNFVSCNAGNKCATSIEALRVGADLYDVSLTINFTSESPDPASKQASWGNQNLTNDIVQALEVVLLANGIEGFFVSGISFSSGIEIPYLGSYQTGFWTYSGLQFVGDYGNHQVTSHTFFDIFGSRATFDGGVVAVVSRRS